MKEDLPWYRWKIRTEGIFIFLVLGILALILSPEVLISGESGVKAIVINIFRVLLIGIGLFFLIKKYPKLTKVESGSERD